MTLDDPKSEDLLRSCNLRIGLLCCTDFQVTARIPLQSPIGSEEPIGDSFPPGGSDFGAPAPEILL